MDLNELVRFLSDPETIRRLTYGAIAIAGIWLVFRVYNAKANNPVKVALREAAKAEKRGMFTDAADHYLQAGEDEMAFNMLVRGKAWLDAATLAMRLGKRDRAASLYERAGNYVEAGKLLVQIRRYEEAAKLYSRVGHHGQAAELLERLGRMEEAAAAYAEAGKLEKAASLYRKRKKWDKAAELYVAAFKESEPLLEDKQLPPKKRDAIHELARQTAKALEKAGKLEKAFTLMHRIDDFEGAARYAAKLGRTGEAAELLNQAGRPDDAAALLEKAGQGEDAKRIKAEGLAAQGDYLEAGRLYREIGQYMSAANAFATIGRVAEAADAAEQAGNYGKAGQFYLKAKEGAKAARCFELDGDYERAASLYDRLGKRDKAVEMLVKGGKLLEAATQLAQAGDTSRALKALDRIGADDAQADRAAVLKGDILLRQGEREAAMEQYQLGLADRDVHAGNLEPYYRFAVLLESAGQAEAAYRTFLRIGRYDPEFKDVRKRTAALRDQVSGATPSGAAPAADSGGRQGAKKRRYVILEELGRGGMGLVYKAMDRVLDRVVAFKVLPSELSQNQQAVKNFFREAKAAAALNHPNIVTVFDAGEEDGNYYIAMEFIQGLTLKQILKHKGPFELPLIYVIYGQVLKGLGYAHAAKIIHRDVKPSNLMWLGKEKLVKITDFGLAKVIQEVVNFQTVVGGTPHYMSPEQILGEQIDPRADIYSLGATMYELATGQVPYPEGDAGYHHIHTPPPNPLDLRPDLPHGLADVIMRSMAKTADDRYDDANAVLAAIQDSRKGASA